MTKHSSGDDAAVEDGPDEDLDVDRAAEEGQVVVEAVDVLRPAHFDHRQIWPERVLEQIEVGQYHQRQQPERGERGEDDRQRHPVAAQQIVHAAAALAAGVSSARMTARSASKTRCSFSPGAGTDRLAVVARLGDQDAAARIARLDADEIALEGDVGDFDGDGVLAVHRPAHQPGMLRPDVELWVGGGGGVRAHGRIEGADAGLELRGVARDVADPAGEYVVLADERGDEAVGRAVVDLLRHGDLLQPALRHHADAVGHRQRLALVVGDVDECDVGALLDGAQLGPHMLAQLQVERRQRLVEQHDLGLDRERPGDRDALLLAAGELADRLVARARKIDQAQQFLGLSRGEPSCRCRAPRARTRCSPTPASAGTARGSGRSARSAAGSAGCRACPGRRS